MKKNIPTNNNLSTIYISIIIDSNGLAKDISSSIVGGVISGAVTKVGIYCVNDDITYYLTKNGITTAGDSLVNTLVKETAVASIQEFLKIV